jgi:hypothetical protein
VAGGKRWEIEDVVTTVTFFPNLCYTRHLKAVVDLLRQSGIDVAGEQPRALSQADIEASSRIITLGCDLAPFDLSGTAVESWNDVPLASQDLPGAWRAIRAHVEQLVARIEQRA